MPLINLRLMNGAGLWLMSYRGSREGDGSAAEAMTHCFKSMNKGRTKILQLPQGRGDSAGLSASITAGFRDNIPAVSSQVSPRAGREVSDM